AELVEAVVLAGQEVKQHAALPLLHRAKDDIGLAAHGGLGIDHGKTRPWVAVSTGRAYRVGAHGASPAGTRTGRAAARRRTSAPASPARRTHPPSTCTPAAARSCRGRRPRSGSGWPASPASRGR